MKGERGKANMGGILPLMKGQAKSGSKNRSWIDSTMKGVISTE